MDLKYYKEKGFRIIYLYETMVTKSTIATNEWSAKNNNYKIDMINMLIDLVNNKY